MGSVTNSTTTTLANLISSYYDRKLIEALDPKCRFYQFAEKRPLPKGEGTSVIWNQPYRLSLGQKLTQGVRPSSNVLSTVKVSAVIEQIGGWIQLTDLVDMTAITNTMDMATERLARQAAETVDTIIRNQIINHAARSFATGGSVLHYIKQSAQQYFSYAASAMAHVYADSELKVSDVREITTHMRSLNAEPYAGEDYVAVVHPVVEGSLLADTTFQNWHQYTNSEKLLAGELGRINNCRFVRSTLAPVSAGSANGYAISASGATSALAYGTIFIGMGAYGVTELDGGVKTYTVTGATKEDPLNQTTTYGWKANIAAKVLNTSALIVAWSGGGANALLTEVNAASARTAAGMNTVDPDTAT